MNNHKEAWIYGLVPFRAFRRSIFLRFTTHDSNQSSHSCSVATSSPCFCRLVFLVGSGASADQILFLAHLLVYCECQIRALGVLKCWSCDAHTQCNMLRSTTCLIQEGRWRLPDVRRNSEWPNDQHDFSVYTVHGDLTKGIAGTYFTYEFWKIIWCDSPPTFESMNWPWFWR